MVYLIYDFYYLNATINCEYMYLYNFAILKIDDLVRTKFSVSSVIEVACMRIIHGLARTNFSDYANHH